jgi:hypothetical protein
MDAADGTFATASHFDVAFSTSSTTARFIQDYTARYPRGELTSAFTAEANDAAMVLITAIKHLIKAGQLVTQGTNVLPDPVVQSSAPIPNVMTTTGPNFDGVGDTSNTPSNPCNCAPSDTNGAVGATQFVQWVNTAFAVYSKSSTLVSGPTAGNTLWSGFGGGCQTNNDGDIIAQYDKIANRWVLSQFSVSTTPFHECVAVSTTSDATGTYARYAFQEPNFNDHPKLGIWPDGYYFSFNMFNGNTFVGARACAFDRNSMLAGGAAIQICFQQSSSVASLLPSDLDGAS